MGQHVSALLVFLLVLASLIAMYEVAQTPRTFSNESHGLDSIQTIRSFYAGLDEYMKTGDASAISKTLAPGALAFVPEQGIMGEDSGLLTYLLALRATYPHLQFSIDGIETSGDLAIASVRMTGMTDTPVSTWPSASGTSKEFFRIHDGHIVEHWTTTPNSVVQYPLTTPPMRVEVFHPGYLAVAKLSFSPKQYDPEPIDGPALVLVEHGHLTLLGDGSSQIVTIATGTTSVPGTNERGSAGPGQTIAILDRQVFVRNEDSEPATALIATVVQDSARIPEHIPDYRPPPALALNDISMLGAARTTVWGAVSVRPLAFDDRAIPNGMWELEIGWVVLGPGAALPLSEAVGWAMAQVVSGTASTVIPEPSSPEMTSTLTNDGDKPAVALVIHLRPVP